MLYRLNDTLHLDLDRETMLCMATAIRAHMRLEMPDKMLAELGNVCATLECMIQRTPEADPNMDLIS